jgi:hypothetical protein
MTSTAVFRILAAAAEPPRFVRMAYAWLRRDLRPARFFENGVSEEERRRILDKWHVRFLVIDTRRDGSESPHKVFATEENRDARFRLLRVR